MLQGKKQNGTGMERGGGSLNGGDVVLREKNGVE